MFSKQMLLILSDPVLAGDRMTRGDDGSKNRRLSDGRPEHLSADLQQQTSLGRNFALEELYLSSDTLNRIKKY